MLVSLGSILQQDYLENICEELNLGGDSLPVFDVDFRL